MIRLVTVMLFVGGFCAGIDVIGIFAINGVYVLGLGFFDVVVVAERHASARARALEVIFAHVAETLPHKAFAGVQVFVLDPIFLAHPFFCSVYVGGVHLPSFFPIIRTPSA